MISLKIDTRESTILHLCQELAIPFENCSLPLGDLECSDHTFRLLFERKSWNDLHSSIADGRYREQRSRLLQSRSPTSKFAYCIDMSPSSCPLSKDLLQQHMVTLHRLMFAYDIPVFFFTNTQSLVIWLQWILEQSSLSVFFQQRNLHQDQMENILLSNHIHKKDIMCSKTWLLSSLLCIHGVSYSIAHVISNEFQSWSQFSHWIFDVHNQSSLSRLENLLFSTAKRTHQKIGKSLASKILSFFYPPP